MLYRKNCYYYELDNLVHIRRQTNNLRRNDIEIKEVFKRIKHHKNWIVEGVYRKDYHFLLNEVDCIVMLEVPSEIRNERILTRWVKQNYGFESCHYPPTVEMLKCMYQWTEGYDNDYSILLEILAPYLNKVIHYKIT